MKEFIELLDYQLGPNGSHVGSYLLDGKGNPLPKGQKEVYLKFRRGEVQCNSLGIPFVLQAPDSAWEDDK